MAAFKNRNAAARIASNPCELCRTTYVTRDACHIVDEIDDHGGPEDWNGLSLCPNCHRAFDEVLRPKLYKALKEFGSDNLPPSWAKSNKIAALPEDETAP